MNPTPQDEFADLADLQTKASQKPAMHTKPVVATNTNPQQHEKNTDPNLQIRQRKFFVK